MDARFKPHRVNDPKFRDAEARVKRRLAANVIGEAGIGNLNDEKRVRGVQILEPSFVIKEYKIWFQIGIRREPERRLLW